MAHRYIVTLLGSAVSFAFAGCTSTSATSPPIVATHSAHRTQARANASEQLIVPFSLSKSLATFDASNGHMLTLLFGKKTKLTGTLGAASDAKGNVYVSGSGDGLGVYEFAAGATGDAAPIAADVGLTGEGLAGDGTHIYVANQYTGEISEYAANPLGGAPIATLSGKKSTLCAAVGIAIDSAENVYVTQQGFGTDCTNDVLEFPPMQAGNHDVAPIRTIAGSKTLVSEPEGIAVDGAGNAYVADGNSDLVLGFSPSENGNVKPAATFGTGAYAYDGVAVDVNGNLFAAASGAQDTYGQIDVFDASKPSMKPTKSYKIGSKKHRKNPGLISL